MNSGPNSYSTDRKCRDCEGALPEWHPMSYCKPCFGRRISKGKVRGVLRAKVNRFPGVDIDAIHFNPRWMKKKLKGAA